MLKLFKSVFRLYLGSSLICWQNSKKNLSLIQNWLTSMFFLALFLGEHPLLREKTIDLFILLPFAEALAFKSTKDMIL